jgi:reactive intermediate/imine deaminase
MRNLKKDIDMLQAIRTKKAPAAIGSYSQAIKVNNIIYLSGQIPLDPDNMNLIDGDISAQIRKVFENLKAVSEAAGGNLNAIVKLTVYLLDLSHLMIVNEVMKQYFNEPYPARTSIEVSALPKGAAIEIDAIMVLSA